MKRPHAEGILIQQSFIPLHRPPLTIENGRDRSQSARKWQLYHFTSVFCYSAIPQTVIKNSVNSAKSDQLLEPFFREMGRQCSCFALFTTTISQLGLYSHAFVIALLNF